MESGNVDFDEKWHSQNKIGHIPEFAQFGKIKIGRQFDRKIGTKIICGFICLEGVTFGAKYYQNH